MPLVPERLITGIPRIDTEHQAIVRLMGWIGAICTIENATNCHGCILAVQDQCGGNLDSMLTQLTNYVTDHFRYEERLMSWTLSNDHVDRHVAAHREMENRIHELGERFRRELNTASVSREVVGQLQAWLVNHIETLDAELVTLIGSEDQPHG